MARGTDYEVAVLGAGPAGCATAMALRQHGISKILLLESDTYSHARVGESMPPDVRLLLQQLGSWEDFLAEGHETCLGSCSAWGDDKLGYNDFLFNPQGHGWHLDRRRFDAFLAQQTAKQGVKVRTNSRFTSAERAGHDGFRVSLTHAEGHTQTISTRFVVDATGMKARFARQQGAKRRFHDRLICVAAFFELPQSVTFSQLTMLEAVSYGWWYAAKLPNRQLTAAVASDPKHMKQAALNQPETWLAHLKATTHVSNALAGCPLIEDSLRVYVAPSCRLDRAAGPGWLAVGDAASAYDPISSQGIYKALSDGLHAARVIAAWLSGDPEPLGDYTFDIATRFDEYLAMRDYFYGLENRWPTSPFWERRQQRILHT